MSIQRLSNAGQSGFRYKTLIAGITPVASVPVIGEATALTFSTASVTFTAPGAYAGATYTATSSPGGFTGTSATSPITVSGLSGDTAYTFTVTATNATGTSGPSAASNSITTPVEWQPEGAFDALSTVTVPSGGVASVTFAGIPTGYKHLQLRTLARNTSTSNGYNARFNSDSGSNYARHYLIGTGSGSGTAAAITSTTSAVLNDAAISTSSTSVFGSSICDILDYSNSSKNKTIRTLGGFDNNGNGSIGFLSGLYMSTSVISSILVFPDAGNFAEFSQFTLYGVK